MVRSTPSSLCSSGFASSHFFLSPLFTVLAEGFPKGKGSKCTDITGRLPPWLDNLIDELRYPIPPAHSSPGHPQRDSD